MSELTKGLIAAVSLDCTNLYLLPVGALLPAPWLPGGFDQKMWVGSVLWLIALPLLHGRQSSKLFYGNNKEF